MCNCLPVRYFTIPKEGTGYKIFCRMEDGRHNSLYYGQDRYDRIDKSGWIKWKTEDENYGFCFFLSEEEAESFANYVRVKRKNLHEEAIYDIVVRKIEYSDGLGEFRDFREAAIRFDVPIALCRAFRILKKDE